MEQEQDVNTNGGGVDTTSSEPSVEQSQTTESQVSKDKSSADSTEFTNTLLEAFDESEALGDDSEEETEVAEDQSKSASKGEEENDQELKGRGQERAEKLNQEIRDLNSYKRQLEAEIAQQEELKQPSVEELANYLMSQDEDLSEENAYTEARLRLIEANKERERAIDSVAQTRQEIDVAVASARQNFPEVFDNNHPDFDKEFAGGVMAMYEDVAGVQYSNNGEVISASVPMGPFLEAIGQIYRLGQSRGQNQSLTKARQQISRASNPYPSQKRYQKESPVAVEVDQLMKGFLSSNN